MRGGGDRRESFATLPIPSPKGTHGGVLATHEEGPSDHRTAQCCSRPERKHRHARRGVNEGRPRRAELVSQIAKTRLDACTLAASGPVDGEVSAEVRRATGSTQAERYGRPASRSWSLLLRSRGQPERQSADRLPCNDNAAAGGAWPRLATGGVRARASRRPATGRLDSRRGRVLPRGQNLGAESTDCGGQKASATELIST